MNAPVFIDRPYQTEAVNSIWTYFATHAEGNPLLAMPTGSGKTIVNARFLQNVFRYYPTQRIMLLTHVKELISQNFDKLLKLWPEAPVGIYSDGLGQKNFSMPITLGGIASVYRHPELFGHIDLVIVDECHLISPTQNTMYQKFFAALKLRNPYLRIIGLTATPWRLGHGLMTEPFEDKNGKIHPPLFTDICYDLTTFTEFNNLVAEGYLLPLCAKPTKVQLDITGVHIRGGEFIEAELQKAVNKHDVTVAALQEALRLGANRKKWLVFAAGVEHAEDVARTLNEMGIPAGCVHSKRDDRDEVIKAFRAGRLRAVVNNNILTTGFDDADIDMIICLRPTASTVLWVQMLGRGTRPLFTNAHDFNLNTKDGRLACILNSAKQDCLVLDYARNTNRLGPINDPVIPKKKGKGSGQAPVRICPQCESYCHARVPVCPTCGFKFPIDPKIGVTATSASPFKSGLPVIQLFQVYEIIAERHTKIGSFDMLKVGYRCSENKVFFEYVCLEHAGYARKKAVQWWKRRSKLPVPNTVSEALALINEIEAPTHLRVWMNKEYPEILSVCTDGTAFGTIEVDDRVPELPYQAPHRKIIGDDIPF